MWRAKLQSTGNSVVAGYMGSGGLTDPQQYAYCLGNVPEIFDAPCRLNARHPPTILPHQSSAASGQKTRPLTTDF
jgi:hypothetical protein